MIYFLGGKLLSIRADNIESGNETTTRSKNKATEVTTKG